MFNKIKILSLSVCAALTLQACHDEDHEIATANSPKQVLDISSGVFTALRTADPVPVTDANSTAEEIQAAADAQEAADTAAALNGLFVLAGTVAGTGTAVGDEPCQVRLHKMTYDTVGGAGEATTATGAVMVPYGDNAVCNGPRPVVLYGHGTASDRDYDLSKIILDPNNAANSEGAIMLAFYAAQGYVVVAPNYAGYADSALSYHPFVDEVQQSTEMINALEHVRTHAGNIGADLSSKLFLTGLSQGGYVAMATHKLLQAKGETVTASVPISGPYAMDSFLDAVMGGFVNGGATTFAPMYLTALEKAHDIYEDPSEVYAAAHAADAENSLPRPGARDATDAGLPAAALFSATSQPPIPANAFPLGFGVDHLLSDTFRTQYLTAIGGSTDSNAGFKVRELAKEADMQDWTPSSPVVMCGSDSDPVVYHLNSNAMASFWSPLVAAGLVTNLDLDDAPAGDFAMIQGAWQAAGVTAVPAAVHGTTGVYCAGAGLALFNTL